MNDRCIITAAVTGGDVVPSQSRYLPITPQQIADEAVRCAEAGAAVVHVHARDPMTGRPSSDVDLFGEIMSSIKARCDAVVCPTTGGNPTMTLEERLRVIPRFRPEMATLNMGSMNYSLHFLVESYERRGREFSHDWERPYLEGTRGAVFTNTFADLEHVVRVMSDNVVKPECEVYDLGMIYNVEYLLRQGLLKPPIQLQFVLGVLGGVRADLDVLLFLHRVAEERLAASGYTWSVIGAGYPQEFRLAALAVLLGGNVRVGMEDNLKIDMDTLARSNAELVEKAVSIVRALDREPATPTEARAILGLKGPDKVGF